MAIRELNRENLPYFIERIGKLTPDSRPLWGTLSAHGLLRHLRATMELSLGDFEKPPITPRWLQPALRVLFFEWITTYPRNTIKAPSYLLPRPEGEFEEERGALMESLERFIDESEAEPEKTTPSPAIGPTTLRYWQRVHGVHMRHHFRQFDLL